MSLPTFQQGALLNIGPGAFTTAAQLFPSAQTAGNANVISLTVTVGSGRPAIPTIADTALNAYQRLSYFYSADGLSIFAVYAAFNIVANTANTVTATPGQASTFIVMKIAEWNGAQTAALVSEIGKKISGVGPSGDGVDPTIPGVGYSSIGLGTAPFRALL